MALVDSISAIDRAAEYLQIARFALNRQDIEMATEFIAKAQEAVDEVDGELAMLGPRELTQI